MGCTLSGVRSFVLPLQGGRRLVANGARPSKDDVERISWGKAAKKKGTGSRGVPHRLNDEERKAFEVAKRKGFVETAGSGYRQERADAPLVNTWRNWCDAVAKPCVAVHKGIPDTIVVDLSPLRTQESFDDIAMDLMKTEPGAEILFSPSLEKENDDDAASVVPEEGDSWVSRPIHQLPRHELLWTPADRSAAKALAKRVAVDFFDFPVVNGPISSSSSKKPKVKAGKARRHGGYGIG